jgi:hypothetical protein
MKSICKSLCNAHSMVVVVISLIAIIQSQGLDAQGFCSSGTGTEGSCACDNACIIVYQTTYGTCDNGGDCVIITCTSKKEVNGDCVQFCALSQYWECHAPTCLQEGVSCSPTTGLPCCYSLQCMSNWCQNVP